MPHSHILDVCKCVGCVKKRSATKNKGHVYKAARVKRGVDAGIRFVNMHTKTKGIDF